MKSCAGFCLSRALLRHTQPSSWYTAFLQPTTPVDNLRLLMKQNTMNCARRVRVPALVARAELDRVVKLASAQRVFDAIASEKEWYEIKGSEHSFQTDCRGADAFEHIAAWLDEHLK